MFRGATAVNLDSKGRVAIPTRYRSEILEKNQGQMVCTVDIRHPAFYFTPLMNGKKSNKNFSHFLTLSYPTQLQRVMLGHATECEMDAQGRILLSGPLRQHAKLEKSLMLVGQLNKFEIWSTVEWHAQIEEDMEIGSSADFASEALKDFSL